MLSRTCVRLQGIIYFLFILQVKGDIDEMIPASADGYYESEILARQQITQLSQNQTIVAQFSQHLKYFKDYDKPHQLPMKCPLNRMLKKSCQSVHELRPHNVRVVGALGDSITKALGAKSKTILDIFTEYIGVSWSIGGDKKFNDHITLPNIIREFNGGHVKGVSTGYNTYFPGLYIGSHLNVAKSAGKARDLPYQAELLVKRIKGDKSIDFFLDWKIITVFIGGNDACDCCIDKNRYSPTNFRNHIQAALDILQKELPRTFVNVVLVPNVVQLREVIQHLPLCSLLHIIECKCVRLSSNKGLKEVENIIFEYQRLVRELVSSDRYRKREDFTVEVQPFFEHAEVPYDADHNPDLSLFAPDCFHFSAKGHEELAIALWNNMFEPVNNKSNFLNFFQNLTCPTEERPYFATWKNSLPNENIDGRSDKTRVGIHAAASAIKMSQNSNPTLTRPAFKFSLIGIMVLIGGAFVVIAVALVKHRLIQKHSKLFKEKNANIIPVVVADKGQPKY